MDKSIFTKDIHNLERGKNFLYNKKKLYYFKEDLIVDGLKNVNLSYYHNLLLLTGKQMDKLLRLIESTDLKNVEKLKTTVYDYCTMMLVIVNGEIKAIDLMKQEIVDLTEKEKAQAYLELFNNAMLTDEEVKYFIEKGIVDLSCFTFMHKDKKIYVALKTPYNFQIFSDKVLTETEENIIRKETGRLARKKERFYANTTGTYTSRFKQTFHAEPLPDGRRLVVVSDEDTYSVTINEFKVISIKEEDFNREFVKKNCNIGLRTFFFHDNDKMYFIGNLSYWRSPSIELLAKFKFSNENEKGIKEDIMIEVKENDAYNFCCPTLKTIADLIDGARLETIKVKNMSETEISKYALQNLFLVHKNFYYYDSRVKNHNIIGYDNNIYIVPYGSSFNSFVLDEPTEEDLELAREQTQAAIMLMNI